MVGTRAQNLKSHPRFDILASLQSPIDGVIMIKPTARIPDMGELGVL